MPKSKRDRSVTLSKTGKKILNRDMKTKLVEEVRGYVDKYSTVFVLESHNPRNTLLTEVRREFKDSKLFFGRNQLCRVAFGVDVSSEYADGISAVAKHLEGQAVLLFTSKSVEEVRKRLETCEQDTYARSGFKATERYVMTEGPLENFTVSQEPYLRKLGLPTVVEKGAVNLLSDYVVCEEGEILTPEKAKLLEYNGVQMATFLLEPVCVWNKDKGFELLR